MIDDEWIYKNLHDYDKDKKSDIGSKAKLQDPHKVRYEMLQEQIKQSVVAMQFNP